MVVQGHAQEEKLIAAAKAVASSTAQLLIACQVKADARSENNRRLQVRKGREEGEGGKERGEERGKGEMEGREGGREGREGGGRGKGKGRRREERECRRGEGEGGEGEFTMWVWDVALLPAILVLYCCYRWPEQQ